MNVRSMNADSFSESVEGSLQQQEEPASKKSRPSTPQPSGDTPAALGPAAKSKKGTLYITVGPQCAGKTTLLKRIFGQSFHKNEEHLTSLTKEEELEAGVDITIDDQALVYIPVPTDYFLQNSSSCAEAHSQSAFPSLNQTVFGKTIIERIRDPSNAELALVVQRLGGVLNAAEFAASVQGNNNVSTPEQAGARNDLIDAIEDVIEARGGDDAILPKAIDLFIVESIFRSRPVDLMQMISNEHDSNQFSDASSETISALDQALHLLKSHATDGRVHSPTAPMSWGNTNTRPREFQSALDAAVSSGRPVEFIVFGGMEACEMIREHVSRRDFRKMSHDKEGDSAPSTNDDSAGAESILCLPKVDRKMLLVRNLNRFVQTGRYIPSTAISDAIVRVESLLASAAAEANKDYEVDLKMSLSNAKFRLDYELSKAAGYHLNDDRTVSQIASRGNDSRQSGRDGLRNDCQQSGGRGRDQQYGRSYYGGRGQQYGRSYYGGRGRYQGGRGQQPDRYQGDRGDQSGRYQSVRGNQSGRYQDGIGNQSGQYQGGRGNQSRQYQGGRGNQSGQYLGNRGGGERDYSERRERRDNSYGGGRGGRWAQEDQHRSFHSSGRGNYHQSGRYSASDRNPHGSDYTARESQDSRWYENQGGRGRGRNYWGEDGK